MSHDGRVVAGSGADVHNMLARLRRGAGEQHGVQRRLAVIDVALREDADHVIRIEARRIGIRDILAGPSDDRPRPGTQEIFAAHLGERCFEPPVVDPGFRHDLLRIGPPYDSQFLLFVHFSSCPESLTKVVTPSKRRECRSTLRSRDSLAGARPVRLDA
jgi:hypothetical protein